MRKTQTKIKVSIRRGINHILESGCLWHGVEHFLVMFPSALLITSLFKVNGISVFPLPSVLLSVGVATVLFIIFTRGNIPFFLGPCFAYIGFTSYYMASRLRYQDIDTIRSVIICGYSIAGILLFLLSMLYRFKKIKNLISFIFPDVVMGPAISLIGLELADQAVEDAGFLESDHKAIGLALITLIIIFLASLLKRRFLSHVSIFIGVILGCVAAIPMHMIELKNIELVPFFSLPPIYAKNYANFLMHDLDWALLGNLIFSVLPSVIVVFIENLGRITVLEGMQKRDGIYDASMAQKALMAYSGANIFAIICAIPVVFYAENIAVMNLSGVQLSTDHKIAKDSIIKKFYSTYSIFPYCVAAGLSIVVSCWGALQDVFMAIPRSVLGAMELFIFALVASPGIQILVESKIDFKKISNQIIAASVLLAGISSLEISFKVINLKGMSLGLTIGVIINLMTKILAKMGRLNEELSLTEVMDICMDSFSNDVSVFFSLNGKEIKKIKFLKKDFQKKIREKDVTELARIADMITIKDYSSSKQIIIKRVYDNLVLQVSFTKNSQIEKYNDNQSIITMLDENGKSQIAVNPYLTEAKLRNLLINCI